MKSDALWNGFAETGDPILYLLYRDGAEDRQDRERPAAELFNGAETAQSGGARQHVHHDQGPGAAPGAL